MTCISISVYVLFTAVAAVAVDTTVESVAAMAEVVVAAAEIRTPADQVLVLNQQHFIS